MSTSSSRAYECQPPSGWSTLGECAVDVDAPRFEPEGEPPFRRWPDFSSLRRTLAMYSFENFLILAVFSSDRESSLPSLYVCDFFSFSAIRCVS